MMMHASKLCISVDSVECLCLHDLSQLSEDVKAYCVSYGHTSTMHIVEVCCISQDRQ